MKCYVQTLGSDNIPGGNVLAIFFILFIFFRMYTSSSLEEVDCSSSPIGRLYFWAGGGAVRSPTGVLALPYSTVHKKKKVNIERIQEKTEAERIKAKK